VRVFFLIVAIALIAALGGLEVASSRAVTAAVPLPAPVESAPDYWR
jgi:hypothetical protein